MSRREWRPPSSTQIDLESTLARAIKTFILKSSVSHAGVEVPDEQAREALHEVLYATLAGAVQEGKRIASGMGSGHVTGKPKHIASRAVALISDIVARIREKVQSILAKLLSVQGSPEEQRTAEDIDRIIRNELEDWAEVYADGVSGDTIHDLVEEEIVQGLKHMGVLKIVCITEGDDRVCPACQANADQGPIPIGTLFKSGQTHAPFHPRCRCNIGPA